MPPKAPSHAASSGALVQAIRWCFVVLALGCSTKASVGAPPEAPDQAGPKRDAEPGPELLERAETALAAEEPARAVALFGRYLSSPTTDDDGLRQAYRGLARAHELLGDCAAAVRTYDAFLDRFRADEAATEVLARRGACEAELGQWERSAASYRAVRERPDLLPSATIEALAREGYALFELERFDEADRVLGRADEVYEAAERDNAERFSTYYFVGMARFYRAAILHRSFRTVKIELPEKVMAERFKKKLDLLVRTQDAYNHAIKAKHVFWVSAAGYQLGHLFGEFYDAMMYAPVPEWLDERQRQIYYEELKKQLRPVINKAVWVFEKNLETARRHGYENPFTERTEAKLSHLQAVLLSDDANLGQPNPALVPEPEEEVGPPTTASADPQRPAERKLFVPPPTPL